MVAANALAVVAVAVLAATFATKAEAVTFGFNQITTNGNVPVADQLSVNVTDGGSGTVDFTFYNIGPIDSFISGIYFGGGNILNTTTTTTYAPGITNSSGVLFGSPATPGNLPSGGFTAAYSADANSPSSTYGVNNDTTLPTPSTGAEWVTINFALQAGETLADVLAAVHSNDLLIGLHVQGLTQLDGTSCSDPNASCSESFIIANPLPPAALLFGSGLVGLGFLTRRRRAEQAS